MQDAWAVALERWPRDGLPDTPGAWIVRTARNRARLSEVAGKVTATPQPQRVSSRWTSSDAVVVNAAVVTGLVLVVLFATTSSNCTARWSSCGVFDSV